MSNSIVKPLSVIRAEFINSLTDLINTSMLPPFIMEYILKDMYNDVHILSQKQLVEETKRYNEQIQNQKNVTGGE